MAEHPIANPTVLAVFPSGDDRISLANILRSSNWALQFAGNVAEARSTLSGLSVGAVISEARLPDGNSWKDLLREIQKTANPPPLIVTDRLADEILWAEVLDLGGYDLLLKPFDAKEALRVVTLACGFNRPTAPRKPAKAAVRDARAAHTARIGC
jgi:DNA-binding response OmpR family regulator